MPTYLITYHGGPGMPTDPAAGQQMLAAFQAWVGEVGDAMRDPGAPLAAAKTSTPSSSSALTHSSLGAARSRSTNP